MPGQYNYPLNSPNQGLVGLPAPNSDVPGEWLQTLIRSLLDPGNNRDPVRSMGGRGQMPAPAPQQGATNVPGAQPQPQQQQAQLPVGLPQEVLNNIGPKGSNVSPEVMRQQYNAGVAAGELPDPVLAQQKQAEAQAMEETQAKEKAEFAEQNPYHEQFGHILKLLTQAIESQQGRPGSSSGNVNAPLIPPARGTSERLGRFFGDASDILRHTPGQNRDATARQTLAAEQLRKSQQTLDPTTQFIFSLLQDFMRNQYRLGQQQDPSDMLGTIEGLMGVQGGQTSALDI